MKPVCKWFNPFDRDTLKGFCEINIVDWNMSIKDIAIHAKGGSTWAQPPAKPQVKDGIVVKDDAGKIQYVPIIEFGSREARDQFSNLVIAAVRSTDDGRRVLGAGAPQTKPEFNDEIVF
jgi:hypothetical protein